MLCPLGSENRVERGCRLALHRRRDVAVDVQRDARRAVPEAFRDHPRMRPGREEERRRGVAQRVEVQPREARAGEERVVRVSEQVPGVERRPDRAREDEIEVRPGSPDAEALLGLRSPVPPERVERRRPERYQRREAAVFGSASSYPPGVRCNVRTMRIVPLSRSTSAHRRARISPCLAAESSATA